MKLDEARVEERSCQVSLKMMKEMKMKEKKIDNSVPQ